MEVEAFSPDFWKAFAPETILIAGLLLIFIVPNLGNSKFRIPLTQTRVPWFFGGRRFKITGSPAVPGLLATSAIFAALGMMTIEVISGNMDVTRVVLDLDVPADERE